MFAFARKIISIHAPREGGDTMAARLTDRQKKFQSTPPARGATKRAKKCVSFFVISIHAPREGGDFAALMGQ